MEEGFLSTALGGRAGGNYQKVSHHTQKLRIFDAEIDNLYEGDKLFISVE